MTAPDPSCIDETLAPADLVQRLDGAVLALIQAAATLFAGSWDDLAEDLRRRAAGRPYLFNLDLELDEPLVWIARLKAYEAARGESLAAAIPDSRSPR